MRRFLIGLLAVAAAASALPVQAQTRQQDRERQEEQERRDRQQRDEDFENTPLPLRQRPNAGPCPFVRILYDAARYVEFEGGQQASAAVGFTGEIEGVEAECVYREADPIEIDMEILFHLGRGPQAEGDSRTYRYWVAVTERNSAILAKQYFDLPVNFERGQDRTYVRERLSGITIPRADIAVSGSNFEVLIGFEVTPEMAEFNRAGARFRIDAGTPSAQ
ncbi:Tat pathway signal sequence domain protein [Brevundimonas sp.]|uniref:Tat pathway signal sequence domain protein n=1 Tax=Brevundimonas sp. TaxID=1871086 RepID=UPI0025E12037|nr:Tat pathway signal sequence domain protein [Brevundimonas sp.]